MAAEDTAGRDARRDRREGGPAVPARSRGSSSAWLALAAVGLLAGWFGLLAWLARTPGDFPLDWLGLWAGDRRDHPRLLLASENWFQSLGNTGANESVGVSHPDTPLTAESDPAYQLARGEGVFLGRWRQADTHRWTVSVWLRVSPGTNAAGAGLTHQKWGGLTG